MPKVNDGKRNKPVLLIASILCIAILTSCALNKTSDDINGDNVISNKQNDTLSITPVPGVKDDYNTTSSYESEYGESPEDTNNPEITEESTDTNINWSTNDIIVTPKPEPTEGLDATSIHESTKEPNATAIPEPTQGATVTQNPKPSTNPRNEVYDAKEYAKAIISDFKTTDMDDLDKIRNVHDYMVVNTKYDIDNVENDTIPKHAYTEEGVLLKGEAVCQGYAYAFQLFMELMDIESKIVVGKDLVNEVGHAWNMVCLGEDWYHIDVTWNDPVPDQGKIIQYKYFLKSDEFMMEDHKWATDNYPDCNSEDYLYYYYGDYIVDSKDNIELKFMEQYDSGKRIIMLLYPEDGSPNFGFLSKYDYVWNEFDGVVRFYKPWCLGDYTVITVFM